MHAVNTTYIEDLAARYHLTAALRLSSLAVLLLISFAVSVSLGAADIAPADALRIIASSLGLPVDSELEPHTESLLLTIRLPRVVLATVVGAALAISGAGLQALFRNPLADPGLIGVSSGAAVAAAAVILFGSQMTTQLPAFAGPWLVPAGAFIGGLGATGLVYRIASRSGYTDVPTMLLAGIAVNAIAVAGIGLFIFNSTDQQMRDLNFWLLGSLGGVTWERLVPAIPCVLGACCLLPLLARQMNALALGEMDAAHLGFNVQRGKQAIIVLCALATGAAVALTGIIAFVGLIVPHVTRLLIGPNHRILLPACILLGASFMLIADLLARLVVLPAELPVGILTSFIGGPFFLWLLTRRRNREMF